MPLLSTADNCYVGSTPITKIFAGSELVWPKSVYPDTPGEFDLVYLNFEGGIEKAFSGVCPWEPYWNVRYSRDSDIIGTMDRPGPPLDEEFPMKKLKKVVYDSNDDEWQWYKPNDAAIPYWLFIGSNYTHYTFPPGRVGKCLQIIPPSFQQGGTGGTQEWHLSIRQYSERQMLGYLELNGLPADGPPTAENTAHVECPAFDAVSYGDVYVEKDNTYWQWTDGFGEDYEWYDTQLDNTNDIIGSSRIAYQQSIECYVKFPEVTEELTEDPLRLPECLKLNQGSVINLKVFLLGQNNVKVTLEGTTYPTSGNFIVTHYFNLPHEKWIHFSLATVLGNASSSSTPYTFHYTIDGKYFTKSHTFPFGNGGSLGMQSNVTLNSVGLANYTGDNFIPYALPPMLDEVRTATQPLYLEDFNPR